LTLKLLTLNKHIQLLTQKTKRTHTYKPKTLYNIKGRGGASEFHNHFHYYAVQVLQAHASTDAPSNLKLALDSATRQRDRRKLQPLSHFQQVWSRSGTSSSEAQSHSCVSRVACYSNQKQKSTRAKMVRYHIGSLNTCVSMTVCVCVCVCVTFVMRRVCTQVHGFVDVLHDVVYFRC
jgi:hypothetical protein